MAAPRKSLPASITMHKWSLDMQKCNMAPVSSCENLMCLLFRMLQEMGNLSISLCIQRRELVTTQK